MLFSAARKGRSRYLDDPGGKADCRAGPDQVPTHGEWHSKGSGPFQGFLRRNIRNRDGCPSLATKPEPRIFFKHAFAISYPMKLGARRVASRSRETILSRVRSLNSNATIADASTTLSVTIFSDQPRHSNAPVIATRYDKLAVNFLSALALATTISFWL